MLVRTDGDIFDSHCQTLVNTCNCYGVMGKGIALAMKKNFPIMFSQYQAYCKGTGDGHMQPGMIWLWKQPKSRDRQPLPMILNYMVKDHWRDPARMEWIEACLVKTRDHYERMNITSLALPYIGAGAGRLPWPPIEALIEKHLGPLPIKVELISFGKEG